MLTLLTFKPALGLHCPSPFGMKAETLLKMSGLDYQCEYPSLMKAPRKKFPVLRDADTLIPDSSYIQTHLERRHGIAFDDHLSPETRATALSFQRLIEDHLYFLNMHFRWFEHGDAIKQVFFAEVPGPLRGLVFRKVQKTIGQTLHLQGLGRHSRPEMIAFMEQDLEALAIELDYKPFFMGDRPSSIDACLYGMLHNLIDCDLDVPGKSIAMKHDNLVAYCQRFGQDVFHEQSLALAA